MQSPMTTLRKLTSEQRSEVARALVRCNRDGHCRHRDQQVQGSEVLSSEKKDSGG